MVARFVLANLLPSILAGAISWGVIRLLYRFLPVRDARRRLALYGVPLLKSALVLLGVGVVLPWPPLFVAWRAAAVPWYTAIPCALIWAGFTLILQDAYRRRAYEAILDGARPARLDFPEVDEVLAEVIELYRKTTPWRRRIPYPFGGDAQRIPGDLPVLASERVDVPLMLTDPTSRAVLLPASLAGRLSREQLKSILAHEVAHLAISRPHVISATWWSLLTPISPIAIFLAEDIQREEERACDAMAAAVLGDPETYAESLVKAFRLLNKAAKRPMPAVAIVPQLTGKQPAISERVEALIRDRSLVDVPWTQAFISYLVWLASWVVLF